MSEAMSEFIAETVKENRRQNLVPLEFEHYDLRIKHAFLRSNHAKKSSTLTPAVISSINRELRYLLRCVSRIKRDNPDMTFKITPHTYIGGYYVEWDYNSRVSSKKSAKLNRSSH